MIVEQIVFECKACSYRRRMEIDYSDWEDPNSVVGRRPNFCECCGANREQLGLQERGLRVQVGSSKFASQATPYAVELLGILPMIARSMGYELEVRLVSKKHKEESNDRQI